jgi:predicted HTH domain antitoxin
MKMGVVKAHVNLPRSFLAAIKVGEDELDLFIRRSLAVELYREGTLSLGKAAEVAGVRNKWEMLMLLNEKGVPLDYTAEDAAKDLKTLHEVLGKPYSLYS